MHSQTEEGIRGNNRAFASGKSMSDHQVYPISIIILRNERHGIDLVADDTHKNLVREVEVYTGVQSLLTRTIEQAIEQLR